MKGWQFLNRHGALGFRNGWLRAGRYRSLQILVKAAKGLFRGALQVQDLPGANQVDGVGPLGRLRGTVKAHDGELFELVVQLLAKADQLSEIEGSKIEKEIPIHEFIVDVEKVNLFLVLLFWFGSVFGGVAFGCRGQNVVTGRRLFQGGVIQAFLCGGLECVRVVVCLMEMNRWIHCKSDKD